MHGWKIVMIVAIYHSVVCEGMLMVLATTVQAKTDVQAGDDDFEAYRKRMMLGYKHRCDACPLPALLCPVFAG